MWLVEEDLYRRTCLLKEELFKSHSAMSTVDDTDVWPKH